MVNSFVLTPLYTQLAMCHALSERKPSDALHVSKFVHKKPMQPIAFSINSATFVQDIKTTDERHA